MSLFGNNFNEGIQARQNDDVDHQLKYKFSQFAKADTWLPKGGDRATERIKGYMTASADIERVNNIQTHNTLTPNQGATNMSSSGNNQLTIAELEDVCTSLKKRLDTLIDDFENIKSNYNEAINYLFEQGGMIKNDVIAFEENKDSTTKKIDNVISDISDHDIPRIQQTINWLNEHPNR